MRGIEEKLGNKISNCLVLLLFIPLFFVALSLNEPGLVVNGDFPVLDTGAYASDKLATWIDKGSYPSVETLQRLPYFGFWYLLNAVGIDALATGKLMIILGFFSASFSFYYSFQLLLKSKFGSHSIKLKIAALVGSLIYAYNIWSFLTIGHWYLWIGYCVLPLFLVSIVYSFRNPTKWKYIIVSAFLWSIASATPHMIIFYGLIFLGTLSVFVVHNFLRKQNLPRLCIPLLSTLVLYLLANFYWIYPVVLSNVDALQDLGPHYVMTSEWGAILSRSSDFLSTSRLAGADWTNSNMIEPAPDSSLYPLWVFASFVTPIVALSAFLYKRMLGYVVIAFLMVIIGIVLAMGTQSPVGYYGALFSIPFGWLFRDPGKWSFLIALGYSILTGIAIIGILNLKLERPKYLKKTLLGCFFALFMSSFGLYTYPIYVSTLGDAGKFSPITVPSELDRLNAYLNTVQTDKVLFVPYTLRSEPTTWSSNHVVENIYQTHSTKPSIQVGNPSLSNPALGNYYTYLEKVVMDNSSSSIDNFIHPFGTSYIIYHNDTSGSTIMPHWSRSELLDKLHELAEIRHLDGIGFFQIFKTQNEKVDTLARQSNILGQNLVIDQGLDKLSSLSSIPSFSSLNSSLLFLDQSITDSVMREDIVKSMGAGDGLILEGLNNLVFAFIDAMYLMNPYDATTHSLPSSLWSKAGAMDPLHGEFHRYIEELGIENWDFDYGKGLVMTQARGATLDIPFNAGTADSYDIFVRFMKSQRGGEIKVYLHDNLIGRVNTLDDKSNSFVWENIISNINLARGDHTITLENVAGFNAVNVFAALPVAETDRLIENAYSIANNTRNIYLLEAESDFYSLEMQAAVSNQTTQQGFIFSDFLKSFMPESTGKNNTIDLAPGSAIYTELDILKPSNYSLAIRADQCEICHVKPLPLRVSIEDGNNNTIIENMSISSIDDHIQNFTNNDGSNSSQLSWWYLHGIDLERGHYRIKIYSDSQRALDSVVLYSANNNQYETLHDIFNISDAPAQIAEYTKIDPTNHSVNITNATRPYILSFAESFDPYWTASTTDISNSTSSAFIGSSLPLYSMINGFIINKLGDYIVTIEYEPQQWLTQGRIISIATIVTLVAYLLFHKYGIMHHIADHTVKFFTIIRIDKKY